MGSEKPVYVRLAALVIQINHIILGFIFILFLLFSNNPLHLFYLAFGFVILQTMVKYFEGCILTRYENVNSDIMVNSAEGLCLMNQKDEESCKNPFEFSYLFSSFGLAFSLTKATAILLMKEPIVKKLIQ